jgi:glyoxylase-like metal-dependent hydrolase (beta-lactamase superfamily II)
MARQLADGVWVLDLGLVPPLATNAYLLDDTEGGDSDDDNPAESASGGGERGVTLVDAGLFWNKASIRDELAAAGYVVADIDRVLLTHYDLDHTTGLNRIANDLHAPVYIGAADARLIDGEDTPTALHHKGLFHRIVRHIAPLPDSLTVEPVEDTARIGRFRAYHTPGHNPGHTVYVHDDSVAFLGDLVWEENGEFTPPFWLDSYDMREVRRSIRQFNERVPGFEVGCVGHGTPITDDAGDTLDQLVEQF